MHWNRQNIKMNGKYAFQGNYGNYVLVCLIILLLTGVHVSGNSDKWPLRLPWGTVAATGITLSLFSVFVTNVFRIGACRFFLESRDYNAPVSKILFGFQGNHYKNVVLTTFLMDLKVLLWYCLLVIPGIIKSYEYRMVPYILAEQPDIPQQDAFAISREMMTDQKFETWLMDLSFFGWHLLNAFTCGLVGIFWTVPYISAANTELYVTLRDHWMYVHRNPS